MRRSLGRGLSQLIAEQMESTLTEVALKDLSPNPNQPRKHFDDAALSELADSIKLHGVLQPLLVRPISEGKYEIVAGERRWRASKLAGLTTVPVVIRSAAAQASLEMAIIENVQREDISAIESATAYRKLIDEFGFTQDEVAQRVGKSRAAVANVLRLLRLPEIVQDAVQSGLISEGHARALLAFESESKLLEAFYRIVDEGLSVRQAEQLTKPPKTTKSKQPVRPARPEDAELETAMRERWQAPVALKRESRGGKIVLSFYSEEDLARILELLGVQL